MGYAVALIGRRVGKTCCSLWEECRVWEDPEVFFEVLFGELLVFAICL